MIFNNFTQKELEEIKSLYNLSYVSIKKNDIIFKKGDTCTSIALIKKGKATSQIDMAGNNIKTIETYEAGDSIGISLLFSSNNTFTTDIYSLADTKLYYISKEIIISLLLNEKFRDNVLNEMSDYSAKQASHIRLLSYKTIRQKLCAYIYEEFIKSNSLEFEADHTKTDLASYLNVERPSLSTEVSKLVADGIINNENRKYTILDLKRLEQEF